MIKNDAKRRKLKNSFIQTFNDMIEYNVKVQNFNVSEINSILKTDENLTNLVGFRSIIISSVMCNLYERLILMKRFLSI
jgi:hypothetical protein